MRVCVSVCVGVCLGVSVCLCVRAPAGPVQTSWLQTQGCEGVGMRESCRESELNHLTHTTEVSKHTPLVTNHTVLPSHHNPLL